MFLCCLEETLLTLLKAIVPIGVIFAIVSVVLLLISDSDLVTKWHEWFGVRPEALAGKVVWVTGASSGIGEQVAHRLTQHGCKVILSARREELLDKVKDACLTSGKCQTKEDDILVLPLDVSDCTTHSEALQKVLKKFDHIDILFNNAGRGMQSKWWNADLSGDRQIFDLNVFGTVSLTQQVLPHMMERGQGHVVVVSSILGFLPFPRARAYVASKHAIQGYFNTLRLEMQEHNIDVTLICPGPVQSDFEDSRLKGKDEELKNMSSSHTMMTSERCARLCCVAVANKMFEAWMSNNPALVASYMSQYAPSLYTWFASKYILPMLKKIGGADF